LEQRVQVLGFGMQGLVGQARLVTVGDLDLGPLLAALGRRFGVLDPLFQP
jgi:hypothetical protein